MSKSLMTCRGSLVQERRRRCSLDLVCVVWATYSGELPNPPRLTGSTGSIQDSAGPKVQRQVEVVHPSKEDDEKGNDLGEILIALFKLSDQREGNMITMMTSSIWAARQVHQV